MSRTVRIDPQGLRSPRHWPGWLLWKLLRLLHRMPLRWHRRIGAALGAVFMRVFSSQRRVAAINLQLCFTDMAQSERDALLRRHFAALGMSFLEMGIAWFSPIERIRDLVKVNGIEHLHDAIKGGRPVLLWGAHSTCLEVGVRILEDLDAPCATMYQPQSNAFTNAMIAAGRSRFASEQIPRDSIRRLMGCLKDGYTVVYFPDQAYVGNQSAVIPFFGEPALTNTAASRIASRTNATILTYFYRRLPNDEGYCVDIGPPLDGIPSDDEIADATRLFAALEAHILKAPEQYLWTYKKFKRRPEPLTDPYRRDVAS